MVLDRRALAGLPLLAVASLAFDFDARAQLAEQPGQVAPASASPVTASPLPYAPPIEAHDDVLRRVLRSGCRDGVPEARALAASGAVPWAATVTKLCGEIIAQATARAARREGNGRGTLVIASTLYGLWVGIATDVLGSADSARSGIIPPLVGMGAGFALSLGITGAHPVTSGEAWSIVTGLEYGSLNGAFWAGGWDLSAQEVVGTTLATGLVGGAAGLLVANTLGPQQGDVEVVRSGLLWGTVTGLLGVAIAAPHASSTSYLRGAAASMDLGFLAGLALASSFEVSRNRDLIIDAATLGGGVAGLGIAVFALGTDGNTSTIAGGALSGMFAGMLTSIYLTRDMDGPDDEPVGPVAALLGRDERGRWRWGTPGPTPVLDGLGRRVVGATFTALGGSF